MLYAPNGPPAEEQDPLIGQRVGAFELIRRLGEGGMGSVYLGEHSVIGSKVAVKLLHPHLAASPEVVKRFFAEARAVNLIGHENIVSIFDLDVLPPNRHYLVMEYLEGQALSELATGPLDPKLAVHILTQVCDGLQAAHTHGVVHRDLKPENIFLSRRGRNEHFVKILDFGIAKLFATEVRDRTSAGVLIGTPEYMSPEQAACDPVDGRSDVYALGVIAYKLLTGRPPFSAKGLTQLLIAHREKRPTPPDELVPGIPAPLCEVVMKALEKEPEQRFASAEAFGEALEQAIGPVAKAAPIPEPPPRFPTSFTATLDRPGAPSVEVRCADLSRGGLFLSGLQELPPLFSRVALTLKTDEGPLSLEGEVVRHVSEEQARAWRMSPGAGVQFLKLSPQVKDAIGRILSRLPAPPAHTPAEGGDREADRVLARYRDRPDDPYLVVGVRADADFQEIRERVKLAREQLEGLRERRLSKAQRQLLTRVLEQLAHAAEILTSLERRAELDGKRANYAGVARCIAAGLSPDALAGLRERHLLADPDTEMAAEVHLIAGEALESAGELQRAASDYEAGLALDPFSLPLHQRYWKLRRRL